MPKNGPMIGRKFIKPVEVKAEPVAETEEQLAANVFLQSLGREPMMFEGAPVVVGNESEPRIRVTQGSVAPDPEEAAERLLKFLPEETQSLIREAQGSRGVPLWQMLLGYVMNAAEQSELFNPYVLASWDVGVGPNEARPCKGCGKMFKSRFPGAINCCNPCAFGQDKHTDECPTRALVSA